MQAYSPYSPPILPAVRNVLCWGREVDVLHETTEASAGGVPHQRADALEQNITAAHPWGEDEAAGPVCAHRYHPYKRDR